MRWLEYLAKLRKERGGTLISVIPAKAGNPALVPQESWIPAFAGMTDYKGVMSLSLDT